MTQTHIATVQPLPSSILHNSTEIRRQCTRAATKQAVQFIGRKLRIAGRKAQAATPDLPEMPRAMHGGH
ncbi:hypothetical protein [Marinobacter sp.]|uniref:hypothetical protein n=1 Tax=Marinobacter sp. TaxID=50741 RepID=UPI0034A2E9B4